MRMTPSTQPSTPPVMMAALLVDLDGGEGVAVGDGFLPPYPEPLLPLPPPSVVVSVAFVGSPTEN